MARSIGTSLAVPHAALAGDGKALAFEPLGWPHLAAWLAKVQALPADRDALPADVAAALAGLKALAAGFGGPARPGARPGTQPEATMPSPPYLGLAWLVERLHALAAQAHALLRALGMPDSAAARRDALLTLNALALRARDLGSPLLPLLDGFRAAVLPAHEAFAAAVGALGQRLQQRWEAVGAQQARLQRLEDELKRTSVLHPMRRKELSQQIDAARQALAGLTEQAEALRLQAAALQDIVDEGAWLDAGIAALIDFVQKLRAAWASFGTTLTQLDAEAGDAQWQDPAWLAQQLSLEQALPRWQELVDASARFQAAPAAAAVQGQQARKVLP